MNREEIKRKYAIRKFIQLLVCLIFLPALGVLSYVYLYPEEEIWIFNYDNAPLYLLLIHIFALIFTRLNWRCPSCNIFLGRKGSDGYCPKCGVEF
jgi:hypothetical protein